MSKRAKDHHSGMRPVWPLVCWTLGCILLTGCAGPQPAEDPGEGQVTQAPGEQQVTRAPAEQRKAPQPPGALALTAQSEKEEIDRGCEKTKTKPKPAATAVASVPAGKHPAEEQAEAGGPMPRWASAAQTITLDPVWQGKPLQYNFAISNKGESDLTIKLRKG